MDEMNGVKPMKPLEELATEEDILCEEAKMEAMKSRALTHEDYMKIATAKIEELMKNCKLRHTFDDDDDDDDEFDNEDLEGENDDEDQDGENYEDQDQEKYE